MREWPSIVPGTPEDYYVVVNHYGRFGAAFACAPTPPKRERNGSWKCGRRHDVSARCIERWSRVAPSFVRRLADGQAVKAPIRIGFGGWVYFGRLGMIFLINAVGDMSAIG